MAGISKLTDIHSEARQFVTQTLGRPVVTLEAVGGGFIASAFKAVVESGEKYFIKGLSEVDDTSRRTFEREAYALGLLAEYFRVPDVLASSEHFLVLEWIDSCAKSEQGYREFGQNLARMHKEALSPTGLPGFPFNNTIGATLQLNENDSLKWPEFFWEKRLAPQLLWAKNKGFSCDDLLEEELKAKVLHQLSFHQEAGVSLLHGDLWGGNHQFDSNGHPWIFDPSSYYGHREADLAMMRLFSGFPFETFKSYEEVWPLEKDWMRRSSVYELYHVLNHFNLFGGHYEEHASGLIRSIRTY